MVQGPVDDKSILVQVMAWCHQTTNSYLSRYWPIFVCLYGVTWPQWIKSDVIKLHWYFMLIRSDPDHLCGAGMDTWRLQLTQWHQWSCEHHTSHDGSSPLRRTKIPWTAILTNWNITKHRRKKGLELNISKCTCTLVLSVACGGDPCNNILVSMTANLYYAKFLDVKSSKASRQEDHIEILNNVHPMRIKGNKTETHKRNKYKHSHPSQYGTVIRYSLAPELWEDASRKWTKYIYR